MALTKVIGSGIGTVTNQFADGNMATGSVLQVVQFRADSYQATTSTSFINYSPTNATITPSSTSSKILVLSTHNTEVYQNNSQDAQGRFIIYRNGSAVSEENYIRHYDYGGSGHLGVVNTVQNFLDSPSSTSSVSYQLYMKKVAGDSTAILSGSITLMEIAG
jgi:hypothetical protein